jgi:hypothetical protein
MAFCLIILLILFGEPSLMAVLTFLANLVASFHQWPALNAIEVQQYGKVLYSSLCWKEQLVGLVSAIQILCLLLLCTNLRHWAISYPNF